MFKAHCVPFRHSPAIRRFAGRFTADQRGNVAMMFALSIIPILFFAGAAVDYGRSSMEQARVQSALDATALMLGREANRLSDAELQTRAQALFAANYRMDANAPAPTISFTRTNGRIAGTVRLPVETAFMKMAGVSSIPVGASVGVASDRRKVEIALVLDNTGSMAWSGKMDALKVAVNDLIDALRARNAPAGDIKLSIVPFNTEVKVDRGLYDAPWLRWDVTLENRNLPFAARVAPSQIAWQGCISDRDQPWDVSSAPATMQDSRYVAAQCHAAALTPMAPLTDDLEAIRARANAMTPAGATNIAIGFTMGLSTLRPDHPMGAASSNAANVDKFVILLTDGDNTMNRWDGYGGVDAISTPRIDTRLRNACDDARRGGRVKVFTIRVIDGNAALLRNCATDAGMYYDVNDAAQLQPVFRRILDAIENLRLAS